MINSLLSAPVSSTSSTFRLLTTLVLATTSVTTNSYSSLSALPPKSSVVPSATFSAPLFSSASLPLLPEHDAATSSLLQQNSAVRKLTRDLLQQKPRHPKQPQIPPGELAHPQTASSTQLCTNRQYTNITKLSNIVIYILINCSQNKQLN